MTTVGLKSVDILQPFQFAGLIVGAMLPYWFSAMTMKVGTHMHTHKNNRHAGIQGAGRAQTVRTLTLCFSSSFLFASI